MLGEFGQVDALELDEEARAIAEGGLGRKVMRAPLPELKGVPEQHYDLIGAFDVIEHIDDDHAAVASIATRLKPGGKLVITVPAHRGCGRPTTSSTITSAAIRRRALRH